MILPLVIISCTEEDYGDINKTRISKSDLDASFTVKEISTNHYMLTSVDKNVIVSKWEIGEGTGFTKFNIGDTIFLPDAGTYTIRHFVAGAGGVTSDTLSKTVVVATSDPTSGNLINGGKFADSNDIAKWKIGGTGSTDGTWTFANGKATLKASGWAGRGIYQAIQVENGKKYKIDMLTSSTTGVIDSWFEVYCGYSDPATVSGDYGEGGKIYSINTWDNSGANSPFSGKLSSLLLGKAADNTGIFTATKTGTVYLVIRGGGSDMKSGISITNVEFRGLK